MAYAAQAAIAAANGVAMLCLNPNHCALKHLIEAVHRFGRNPGWDWEFSDESFVGLTKRIAMMTHASTSSSRTAARWLIGFLVQVSG